MIIRCIKIPAHKISFDKRNIFLQPSGGSLKVFLSTSEKKGSKTWERSAKLVKNISVTNQYLEHIRESHDPSMQLKTIEDEIKGTMGKALGKAGEKVTRAIRCMNEQKLLYNQRLQNIQESGASPENHINSLVYKEIETIVLRFNDYRKQALHARWELIVHRQAIGFTVNNQKCVSDLFPIEEPLVAPWSMLEGGNVDGIKVVKGSSTQQFGDQLDWWQRVGRWR